MTEQEAALWLENLRQIFEKFGGRLCEFMTEFEQGWPGYWKGYSIVTEEALRTVIEAIKARSEAS